VASYNVWFGPPDPAARGVHPEERMDAIVDLLHDRSINFNNSPSSKDGKRMHDFIGFQEVTMELAGILVPKLKCLGYHVVLQPEVANAYGCALAVPRSAFNAMDRSNAETKSSLPFSTFTPYCNSVMARGILHFRTATHLYCTTHLESYLSKESDGSKQRERQMLEIENFCKRQFQLFPLLEAAIVLGDLNWDDERARSTGANRMLLDTLHDSSQWKDTWLEWHGTTASTPVAAGAKRKSAKPKKIPIGGFTYDGKLNPMLSGSLRRRFDRCLVFANESKVDVSSYNVDDFRLVGQSALVDKRTKQPLQYRKFNPWQETHRSVPVAASDHFGLVISLSTDAQSAGGDPAAS